MIHLFLTYPFVGQKLKTSVKKHNVNPVWNEDLTLSVSEPIQPITIVCIYLFLLTILLSFYVNSSEDLDNFLFHVLSTNCFGLP